MTAVALYSSTLASPVVSESLGGSNSRGGVEAIYDRTERSYSPIGRADPGVTAVIGNALGGMATVASIGARTGSYEPVRTVVAVEPSRIMISQRAASSAAAVQALAERPAPRIVSYE